MLGRAKKRASTYNYKYNGKELQDEFGLNMYDYGNRLYDPARSGWSTIDPLAEVSRRWSPYNYAYDNPNFFVDPDGMLSQSFIDQLWEKSGPGETKWSNSNDGMNDATFSSDTGKTADSGEGSSGGGEDPPKKKGSKSTQFDNSAFKYASLSSVALLADDATGIGVVDDPATVAAAKVDNVAAPYPLMWCAASRAFTILG